MGSPGWKASVKRSGTSTQFTDEPTLLVPGTTATYQISNPVRRVLDRTEPVVVKDNGEVVSAENIAFIDYLFGKVRFVDGYEVQGDVTVSGYYLPLQDIAGAHSYTLTLTADVLDSTDFQHAKETGYRKRQYGLQDASLTVTRWDDLTGYFKEARELNEVVVVEVRPGEGEKAFRAFMLIETTGSSGDVGALESEELSFQLDGDGAGKAFSWDLATA